MENSLLLRLNNASLNLTTSMLTSFSIWTRTISCIILIRICYWVNRQTILIRQQLQHLHSQQSLTFYQQKETAFLKGFRPPRRMEKQSKPMNSIYRCIILERSQPQQLTIKGTLQRRVRIAIINQVNWSAQRSSIWKQKTTSVAKC